MRRLSSIATDSPFGASSGGVVTPDGGSAASGVEHAGIVAVMTRGSMKATNRILGYGRVLILKSFFTNATLLSKSSENELIRG
ncbi:MAG: hypothetical protein ACOX5Q_03925, partial [Bacillota bacterium]